MNQEIFRHYSIEDLRNIINRNDSKKIFLVVGKASYKKSGAEAFIKNNFDNITEVFSDFNPNPQISDLKKGISIFKDGDFDLIIAIGGGSVLDMAKLISVFAHQDISIEDILENQALINDIKTPLLAIPTTSGTGAEATAFAVLYVDKVKYSVACNSILPDYVYLSSQFSLTAPAYLTACTGLDAFCQAIESVWSVNSTTESQEYAFKAVELIWHNLKKAVTENNEIAKTNMLEAAFLAGKAINISKTTAPHAMSYSFTSYYNIPHGHAVSLSLAYFFEYNYGISNVDCNDNRGSDIVKARMNKLLQIMNIDSQNINTELKSFFDSLGVNTDIRTLIENLDPELITKNVNIERLKNNPRKIDKQIIADFFR